MGDRARKGPNLLFLWEGNRWMKRWNGDLDEEEPQKLADEPRKGSRTKFCIMTGMYAVFSSRRRPNKTKISFPKF